METTVICRLYNRKKKKMHGTHKPIGKIEWVNIWDLGEENDGNLAGVSTVSQMIIAGLELYCRCG